MSDGGASARKQEVTKKKEEQKVGICYRVLLLRALQQHPAHTFQICIRGGFWCATMCALCLPARFWCNPSVRSLANPVPKAPTSSVPLRDLLQQVGVCE